MNSEEFPVQIPDGGEIRADKFAASLGLFTRSQISRRSVRVIGADGRELKPARKLKDGDTVTVEWDDPPSSDIEPEDIPLDIVFENDECLVINKPRGMVVHPAHGHYHGTLVQGLLYRCSGMESAFGGDRIRPGVVHRLDKDTSGLIVAAKNPESLETLSRQFRDRTVRKTYLAITRGRPADDAGEINDPIGRDPLNRKKFNVGVRNAKDALSRYRVLAETDRYALLQVRILTGRTHQIRVHLKSRGCPVLGDPLYGRRDEQFPDATLMLHSWKLTIDLPGEGRTGLRAPLPGRFLEICRELGWDPPAEGD